MTDLLLDRAIVWPVCMDALLHQQNRSTMKTLFIPLFAATAIMLSFAASAQQFAIDDSVVNAPAADYEIADLSEPEQIATLGYCMPNPVSMTCAIGYLVPREATLSQIIIQNAQGIVVSVSDPLQSGKGIYSLPVENLPNGNYYYTLTVDFAKIETRGMIISH